MNTSLSSLVLRPWQPSDQHGVIDLINSVYEEYGDRICLEQADSDLTNVSANYVALGGAFVVLADRHRIVGSHAVLPYAGRSGICTFRRLYLSPDLRGSGSGEWLMNWAVDWAIERGMNRVEFWSDTRFSRAHTFFERCGLQRDGKVRHMADGSMPYSEYYFSAALTSLKTRRLSS